MPSRTTPAIAKPPNHPMSDDLFSVPAGDVPELILARLHFSECLGASLAARDSAREGGGLFGVVPADVRDALNLASRRLAEAERAELARRLGL